jgi:D-alanyl-D-alanine carboxypeptidase/D-alanyl-D-alanine-endopeptidase (penicillin-binding protein 4)
MQICKSLFRRFLARSIFSVLPALFAASVCAAQVPPAIQKALKQTGVNPADFSFEILPLEEKATSAGLNESVARRPASVMKIVTAASALDLLSPAKTWTTRLYTDGEVKNGVLNGNLYLVGTGDPSLDIGRIWLLVENMKARGVRSFKGTLYVDRSSFEVPEVDPFAFDGEGNRPYNLGPDAAMLNYRAFVIEFRIDENGRSARLYHEPNLSGIKLQESVPVKPGSCEGWRKTIQPDFSNPYAPRFKGYLPKQCGNKNLLYTALSANDYVKLVFSDLMRRDGGSWNAEVKDGTLPEGARLLADTYSEPLQKILYNMNKYSNNLIARQVFLALGETEKHEPKTLEKSRSAVTGWMQAIGAADKDFYIDNGSGLSRRSKITASALNRVVRHMWNSPMMPEFISTLPISGLDGTMKKRKVASGYAHIKTGYLNDARSICGVVQAKSGRRFAVSAIVNGKDAAKSLPLLNAVIEAARDR